MLCQFLPVQRAGSRMKYSATGEIASSSYISASGKLPPSKSTDAHPARRLVRSTSRPSLAAHALSKRALPVHHAFIVGSIICIIGQA
ncbi:hypothetical protein PENSPDRAFT_432507 [Peniophora sp. CONT]|nr:hypothetical protein PENSPDRAFT_432507 [Peniophora sp. CONT]